MSDKPYITRAGLKREFGLTDRLIALLGEPDLIRPNPYYRNVAPMKLYTRSRVEEWMDGHTREIEAARPRQQAARRAVETKREIGKAALRELAAALDMRPVPDEDVLYDEIWDFLISRYDNVDSVSQKAVCSFIRHNYTNYEAVLQRLKGLVGKSALYQDFKLYLNCLIIQHYELDVDPIYATTGNRDAGCVELESVLADVQARIFEED